ncbi:hypothetical protein [Catellatospora sp. NPDC049133]|uniref:hypothetical protein n=1 Tax=Catellatospora sp. NPDC049133 TaxID=3155499 RepID=UPI00340BE75D
MTPPTSPAWDYPQVQDMLRSLLAELGGRADAAEGAEADRLRHQRDECAATLQRLRGMDDGELAAVVDRYAPLVDSPARE